MEVNGLIEIKNIEPGLTPAFELDLNECRIQLLQNNEHPATINYSIKNNLIILHIPDKSGSNCFIADTLAYNGGFIFYSKVCHLEDQYTELQIRCFHERKGIVKKSKHIRRWVTTNEEQARHKSYDYPEYAFFNHICHNSRLYESKFSLVNKQVAYGYDDGFLTH